MALKEDLAKLIDIGYFRRGTWIGRGKLAGYLVPALAFAAWLAVDLRAKDSRPFSKGPLSPAHAPLVAACDKCHVPASAWRPVKRLFAGADPAAAALNGACLVCHASTIAADASTSAARHAVTDARSSVHEPFVACSSCHHEHEGSARLAIVEDGSCVSCHADLAAHRPAGIEPRVRGAGERIPSMAEHAADFAALARPDPSSFRFDHAAHLRGPVTGPGGERVSLACADCHEDAATPGRFSRLTAHEGAADAAGGAPAAFKSRIRYALHCARCHPLVVDERLAGDADAFPGGVPHEAPALIRSWLRGQLLAQAQGAPGAVAVAPRGPSRLPLVEPAVPASAPPPRAGATESRIPLVAPRAREPRPAAGPLRDDYRPPADPAARPAWVERAVASVESRLYAAPSGACFACHPAPDEVPGLPTPELAPRPAIPERWLACARFDHSKHEQVECARCHLFRRADGKLAPASESTSARDVLLAPGIAGCKTCHAEPPAGELARAPSRCTTCHRYHRTPLGPGHRAQLGSWKE